MAFDKFDREKIVEYMYPMYDCYNQYKLLHKFYMDHKNVKGEEEMRSRIKYILKHKIKQRSEIETILWILGEKISDYEESNEQID